MDERLSRVGAADNGLVTRRTVNLGAAWSVPVVLAAVAAPAAQGSPTPTDQRTAVLGTAWGEKGEADGPNRQVWFTFSFTGVTGSNTIQLLSITAGPWFTLPTDTQSFSAASGATTATVTFMLERPDNNAASTVDITYLLNGATKTATGVVIKNKDATPKKP